MKNQDKVGPAMYPYRSHSMFAMTTVDPDSPQGKRYAARVFWSPNPNAAEVPCPFDPNHPKGNSSALVDIGLLVEVKDGRHPGGKGEAEKRFDLQRYAHIPADQRPPFPASLTRDPNASTSFYCLYPEKIDKAYKAPKVQSETNTPPVISE